MYVDWYEAGDAEDGQCDILVGVYTPDGYHLVRTSDLTPEGEDGCPTGPPDPGWGTLLP